MMSTNESECFTLIKTTNLGTLRVFTALCAGNPDRYNKINLECDGNSSLVVFKQLQRPDIDCMLEELMKEDWDNSKSCIRWVVGSRIKTQ